MWDIARVILRGNLSFKSTYSKRINAENQWIMYINESQKVKETIQKIKSKESRKKRYKLTAENNDIENKQVRSSIKSRYYFF